MLRDQVIRCPGGEGLDGRARVGRALRGYDGTIHDEDVVHVPGPAELVADASLGNGRHAGRRTCAGVGYDDGILLNALS